MAWTAFHRRGEVLRDVTAAVDARRDGLLPMDVPGVRETFGDELGLVAALQLRWHTRLSGHLERALGHQPTGTDTDADSAVIDAWHAAAEELPGTRLVLDHYRAEPLDDAMAHALATSAAKEHVLLAAMAGRNGSDVAATVFAGRALEEQARATSRPTGSRDSLLRVDSAVHHGTHGRGPRGDAAAGVPRAARSELRRNRRAAARRR